MSFIYFYISLVVLSFCMFFFFNDTATTEIYTLSLHDALPISPVSGLRRGCGPRFWENAWRTARSEEHTSELQSRSELVCRLLLEKKKNGRRGGWSSSRRARSLRAASSASCR